MEYIFYLNGLTKAARNQHFLKVGLFFIFLFVIILILQFLKYKYKGKTNNKYFQKFLESI